MLELKSNHSAIFAPKQVTILQFCCYQRAIYWLPLCNKIVTMLQLIGYHTAIFESSKALYLLHLRLI